MAAAPVTSAPRPEATSEPPAARHTRAMSTSACTLSTSHRTRLTAGMPRASTATPAGTSSAHHRARPRRVTRGGRLAPGPLA